MEDFSKEAERNLANYARLLEEQGCGKEESFQLLLAEFTGTPYAWGEETTEASDCSGTVCAALNALLGTKIRVTADDLFRLYFTLAAESEDGIQAVFFLNREGRAVHIAGYIGNGLFLNESSIEELGGTPRTLDELETMYCQFMCVRRQLKEDEWV